ncbi:hypothetical protein N9267_00400 [bacterium]|nr:hypothetical protein [bacterium]
MCKNEKDTLYRIREKVVLPWKFVCKDCLPMVRDNNFEYQYGGTWKSKKRH